MPQAVFFPAHLFDLGLRHDLPPRLADAAQEALQQGVHIHVAGIGVKQRATHFIWLEYREQGAGVSSIQPLQVRRRLAQQLPLFTQQIFLPDRGYEQAAALIDHILARYHEVHRAQLPELIRMARRVEAVHRDNPNVPAGLADLLETMEGELLMHMQKEEDILFPLIKSGGISSVAGPIRVMRAEHTEAGAELEKIAELTHDATPPAGACNTWRALYAGIAQFSEDLMNHIHLENNVLFPQFEA